MGWTVLCVSKISSAQVTRKLILEHAGYQVLSTDNPGEAARIFSGSVVHAVVFGDSIRAEECLELARTLRRLNQTAPIIALSKSSGTQFSTGVVDEQLETLGDPQLLLETLQRMILGSDKQRPAESSDPEGPRPSSL